jgi:hypothetical protein
VLSAVKNAVTSTDADIAALRAVTQEVYRISSRYANSAPGAFALPIDALRQFVATGGLPPAYVNDPVAPTPPARFGFRT